MLTIASVHISLNRAIAIVIIVTNNTMYALSKSVIKVVHIHKCVHHLGRDFL